MKTSLLATVLAVTCAACTQSSNPASPSAAAGVSGAALATGGAATNARPAGKAPADNANVNALVAAARAATAKYHDPAAAMADGYIIPPVEACLEVPGMGTMGMHAINPTLAADLEIDPAKPELLLYVPRPDGGLRLVAVEYFAADAGQPRPVVLGEPFDGPMAGHEAGMPVHYDKHVWAWAHNPNGMFEQFNPAISCTPR